MKIIVLAGDRKKDELMHRAGVFESFKRLVNVFELELNYSKRPKKEIIEELRKAYNTEYFVTAVFIEGDDLEKYIDPTVKVISTGKNWCLLLDFMAQYFQPKTYAPTTS